LSNGKEERRLQNINMRKKSKPRYSNIFVFWWPIQHKSIPIQMWFNSIQTPVIKCTTDLIVQICCFLQTPITSKWAKLSIYNNNYIYPGYPHQLHVFQWGPVYEQLVFTLVRIRRNPVWNEGAMRRTCPVQFLVHKHSGVTGTILIL
jgi:hypothetical protein